MARKKSADDGFNPLGWMVTFSDLVTLLLTFFVMLLSMKAPEVTKLKAAFGVFTGGTAGTMSVTDRAKVSEVQRLLNTLAQPKATDLMSQKQAIAELLSLPGADKPVLSAALMKEIRFRNEPRGLVITLANDILYPPGKATLSEAAKKVLKRLSPMLIYSDQPISVEGHSDATPPPKAGPYKTNWDLALARAQAVRGFLERGLKIHPSRIRVATLGASRPVARNDTPERRRLNRRTEIVVLLKGN